MLPVHSDKSFNDELCAAAQNGRIPEMEKALSQGAELEARSSWSKETPLLLAASFGRVKTAEWLISKGANLEAVENTGSTPLLMAIYNGHTQLAKLFLESGANASHKNSVGQPAIFIAAQYPDVDLLRMIHERDPVIHPFHLLHKAAMMNRADNIEYLVSQGYDPNFIHSGDGRNALHEAALYASSEAAAALIRHGCSLETKDKDGRTPLETAGKDDFREQMIAMQRSMDARATLKNIISQKLSSQAPSIPAL